ncbi:MAG: hypothetical protein SVT56_06115 [Chloroflexota bacterium]|nr:hypothetical protein [Chloroflexota bacterium]
MSKTDDLMNTIVSDAMLNNGASPTVLAARGGIVRGSRQPVVDNQTRWAPEEDRYLRENLGRKPLKQIAKELGRSVNALKVKFTRLGYNAPTKISGWLTLNKASKVLGVDAHATKGWFLHGILPGRYAYVRSNDIVMIKLDDLKYWATRPQHWPYFDVNRMAPGYLRRLVEKAQARWGDEWLTTRQVADLLGLKDAKTVLMDIQHGYLPALQCPHIGGRDEATWAYWFIRKSDALVHHHPSRGEYLVKTWFTDRAEVFLRKLVAEGKNSGDAARLMKQDQRYLSYRMNKLRKEVQ